MRGAMRRGGFLTVGLWGRAKGTRKVPLLSGVSRPSPCVGLAAKLCLGIGLGLFLAASAQAGKPVRWQPLELFGRKIALIDTDDDGRQLEVEGKLVAENGVIALEKIGVIGQAGYAIGYAGSGGNACAPARFIIAFLPGKPARFDGPIGECQNVEYVSSGVGFVFEESTSYGNGTRWVWLPETGFSAPQKTATAPDPMIWLNALDLKAQHPSQIFSYGTIASRLVEMLGPDEATFKRLLNGLGSVDVEGDAVVGSSCLKIQCPDETAFYIVDVSKKQVFLAWKESDKPIAVRPDVKAWPPAFRRRLAEWARPFK